MTIGEIKTKYVESFEFLQARKKRQAAQLVLLSNLRRGDQYISSTLLLTLFNRIMSNIYDDKLQVKFTPAQGITQNQINAYNTLAQSDYLEMNKAKIDYDWNWDALFFGRGFLETVRFDRKKKIMVPQVINPLVFGYDPYFEDPQDWRYYWKWIVRKKRDLEEMEKAGLLEKDVVVSTLPVGMEENLWNYKVQRDAAREAIQPSIEPAGNDVIQLLEFYGYKDGKKYLFWTDKTISKIIYQHELDLEDGDDVLSPTGEKVNNGSKRSSKWPIIVKESFRIPHSSVPISIADVLEDKHRAKSVLLNLAYIAAKDQVNPVYGYNPDKVRDISQFFNRQISQHIPMDDESAVWPLNKSNAMSADLINFISLLTAEANEPIGTGQVLQPIQKGNETATAEAIDQQLSDLAQSLYSKVMHFGETEFWLHWFHRYAKYADELGIKIANIVGVKGVESKLIDLKDFKTDFPPGVFIYSTKEAEYKDLVKRRDYMQIYPNLAQSIGADGLRNFNKHVFFPLFLQDASLVDVIFPKSVDEMRAEEENAKLSEGMWTPALPTDNHVTHLYIHQLGSPKTWQLWLHIRMHNELLDKQKEMGMATMQQDEGVVAPVPSGRLGQKKTSPKEAAVPLKSEIETNLSGNLPIASNIKYNAVNTN